MSHVGRLDGAALVAILCWSVIPGVHAQVSAFLYAKERVPAGQTFHFLKSNIDGSHARPIHVRVGEDGRIESLKQWAEPAGRATLVVAHMDWQRFSVRRFENWELNCGQPPKLRGTLESNKEGIELRLSMLEKPVRLTNPFWHSYDFDFMSLNLILPHWLDPQGGFHFLRADFLPGEPVKFAEIGVITVRFERPEARDGIATRRYSIGGPGLNGSTGTWWSDAATGLVREFQIPIPDEPGYQDVRLQLQAAEEMSHDLWDGYKDRTICTPSARLPSRP